MNLLFRFAASLGLLTAAFAPVVNAQQAEAPAHSPHESTAQEPEDKLLPLLANGTVAPDFTALDMKNNSVKLSDFRGKVVVLDFWATWCVPCNVTMPRNQAIIQKFQAQGLPVALLAVDNSDGRLDFEAWVKPRRAKLSALKFLYVSPTQDFNSKKYQVTRLPAQYVLDKNGVIRASFPSVTRPDSALIKAIRDALGANNPTSATAATGKK